MVVFTSVGAGILITFGMILGPGLGPAESAESVVEGEEPATTVPLTLAGPPDSCDYVRVSVEELLDRIEVTPTVEQREGLDLATVLRSRDPSHPLRVWIDLTDSRRVLVVIADGGSDRILVERVETHGDLGEVEREQIGYVVQASVEALLAGAEIGVSSEAAAEALGIDPSAPPEESEEPEEPTPPAQEPSPPETAAEEPTPRPGPGWLLAAGYEVHGWRSGLAPRHGPALEVGAQGAGRWGVGGSLELGIGLAPPLRIEDAIEVTSLAVAPRVRFDLGPRVTDTLRVALGAGVGLDVVRSSNRGLTLTSVPADDQTTVLAIATARVGPRWRMGSGRDRLLLGLGLELDVDLTGQRFTTTDGQTARPWRLRPGGYLQLGWHRAAR